MADDALDAIAPEAAPAAEVAPEPAPAPQPEVPQAPAPEPAVAEPVAEKPQDHTVPLAKYLDTRDELKELRRWKAEQESKASPPQVPDPIDDLQGHHAYLQSQMGQAITTLRFEQSDVMAKQVYGEEVVQAALDWANGRKDTDPTLVQGYMQSPHPVDYIVRQHQRDGLTSQLPTDIKSLDEYVEREIAKRGLGAAAVAQAPVVPQPAPAPPRSIASDAAPSAPNVVYDQKAEFEAIFAKG